MVGDEEDVSPEPLGDEELELFSEIMAKCKVTTKELHKAR